MKRYLSQDEINEKKQKILWGLKQLASPFSVRYPEIASCIIEYRRKSDSPGGDIIDKVPKTLYVNIKDSSSLVTIECNNCDCTKGYFDMSGEISNMVSHHETNRQGKKICDGFQDAERMDNILCRCELKYEIKIEYKQ